MNYLKLFSCSVALLFISSCDLDKSAQDSLLNGLISTRDLRLFADQADSVLEADYIEEKIVIPDSAKGMFGLKIFCVEKYLLDLIRDYDGTNMEKMYSARDTFSWISAQTVSTSIFYAMEGDSTCLRGMNGLNANYKETGLPWILVVDAYLVDMPYMMNDEEFSGGTFLADVYLVDYIRKKVLRRFEFEGSSSETVSYKDLVVTDNADKKLREDFMKNVNKQMSEQLAKALGEESLPGTLAGLEDGGFFTNYSQTKKIFDSVKKDTGAVKSDSIQ
jgi:hypothetical protein